MRTYIETNDQSISFNNVITDRMKVAYIKHILYRFL